MPDRDERDDHGGELALGRQHRDEPADVHPGADVRGHLVEHLRGVAACLALHEREDGDLIDVADSASAWRSPRAPRRAGCRAARPSRRGGTRASTAPAPRRRRRPSRPRGCGPRGARKRARRGSRAAARRSRSGRLRALPRTHRLRTIGGTIASTNQNGPRTTPAKTATSSPARTEARPFCEGSCLICATSTSSAKPSIQRKLRFASSARRPRRGARRPPCAARAARSSAGRVTNSPRRATSALFERRLQSERSVNTTSASMSPTTSGIRSHDWRSRSRNAGLYGAAVPVEGLV